MAISAFGAKEKTSQSPQQELIIHRIQYQVDASIAKVKMEIFDDLGHVRLSWIRYCTSIPALIHQQCHKCLM